MSIITSFTLRSLKKNRVRSIVSIIGIALSCALITAIFTTVTSLQGSIVQSALASSGSWEVSFSNLSTEAVGSLEGDEHVQELAVGYELGSATMTASQDSQQRSYLTVKSLPKTVVGTREAVSTEDSEDVTVATVYELASGRMPTSAGEIVLPEYLMGETPTNCGIHSDGAIELGSIVTLEQGQRVRTSQDGVQGIQSAADVIAEYEGTDATEELANVQQATYTVVGFTSGWNTGYTGEISSSAAGQVALVAPMSAEEAGTRALAYAYASTNLSTYGDIQSWSDEVCGIGSPLETGTVTVAIIHDNLLRYQGKTDDRALWSSLWMFAAILVAIVVLASVSLVYTSFAISVTERTRQLGLLSGIGASARQLRQSVISEALMLGAVGIPAGIALGIAGTAATLSFMRSMLTSLELGLMSLHVDWRVIALAIGISLVTLLVSAWIPAIRASRVSAVDAMRQTSAVRLRKGRGRIGGRIASALFGVPGLVAHRNLTRSSSRSRVVVASLAVSVMLVVVCGCIDAYISPLADVAGNSSMPTGTDIAFMLSFHTNGTEDSSADVSASFAEARSEAAKISGVSEKGVLGASTASATMPTSMVGSEASARLTNNEAGILGTTPSDLYSWEYVSDESDDAEGLGFFSNDGSYTGHLNVYYLADSEWRAYVRQLGLSEDQYCDSSSPVAIGVGSLSYSDADEGRYVTLKNSLNTGTVTLYGAPNAAENFDETYTYFGAFTTEDGEVRLTYTGLDANGNVCIKTLPTSEATSIRELQVGAVANELPSILSGVGANANFPAVILPMSAMENFASLSGDDSGSSATATLYLSAENDVAATKQLNSLASKLSSENSSIYAYVYDVARVTRTNIDSANLIRLLVALFSVITMLIALANVFNTLTNSIILRTREFAVLKSVGMGDAAFRRMMLYECASYALRGLVFGLLLSLGFSYLMWRAMNVSFEGMGVVLSLPYVLIAVAGTAVVLLTSALYALHRSNAQNVVEALRMDTV